MEIKKLVKRPNLEQDKKLNRQYVYFDNLINELTKRELPSEIVNTINKNIEKVNSFSGSNKGLRKQIQKSQSYIFTFIEKELKLVPKNFYLIRWMIIGMSVFGIPLGVAFGASVGNMGLLGIGLPIGMSIGMAVGVGMDKKAFEKGNQLDMEMKS